MGGQNELNFNILAKANLAAIEKLVQMLERLEGKLDALDRKRVNPKIDVDTAKADRDIGAFARNLETKIQAAIRSLPKIELDSSADEVERDLARIRAELQSLSNQRIGIGINAEQARTEVDRLIRDLERLGAMSPSVQVKADVAKAIADLKAVEAAARGVDGSVANIDANVSRLTGRITEFQKIMLAVVALFPLIGAAIVGLPAAIMALAVPFGAIALGMDGIKAAFAPLEAGFTRMKAFVSAAFEQGLAPAVANIAQLMDGLGELLGETAERLSLVAFAITDVVASARGMDDLFASMNNVNDLIGAMAPGFALLTANFLALARAGTEGMLPFAAMFEQVGQTWQRVIASMESTGTVQAAVAGLLQLFAALLDVLAPLTQLAAQVMAVLGPPLAAALQLVSAVLQPLVAGFAQLPSVIQTAIVAATAFRLVLAIMGRNLDFTRKGADAAAQSITKAGQATQQAGNATQAAAGRFAGIRTALAEIGTAYQAGAVAGAAFGQRVAEGATRAAAALSGALVAGAQKAGQAISALGAVFDKIGAGFGRLSAGALFSSFATSVEQGMARAATAALNGVNAVAAAVGRLPQLVGAGLDRVSSVLTTAGSLWGRALDVGAAGITRGATAIHNGLRTLESGVATAATAVNGAVVRMSDAFGRFAAGGGVSWAGTMTAAGNAARSLGDSMRSLGASVTSGLSTAFNSLPTAVNAATGAVTRFASVAGGTARAAMSGLGQAASGLLGALGGPWGAVLTGATVLLSLWGAKQQEAAQKAAEHKAAVDALATSLQSSGGAINANVQALVAKQAEEAGLLASAQKLGISTRDVTLAITGQGSAYEQVRGQIAAAVTSQDGFAVGLNASTTALNAVNPGLGALANQLGLTSTETLKTGASLKTMSDRFKEAQESQQRLDEAVQGATASMNPQAVAIDRATAGTQAWSAAMKTLADGSASATEKTSALSGAFTQGASSLLTLTGAQQKANDLIRTFGQEVGRLGPGLVSATGQINTQTAAGSQLATSIAAASKSYGDLYGATLQNAQATGQGSAAFATAANASANFRNQLVETLVQQGLSREEATRLAQAYLQIPPEIKTTITQPGMVVALANFLGLKGSISEIPDNKSIIVTSLAPEVKAQLEALGLTVRTLPDGRILITADPKPAEASAAAFRRAEEANDVLVPVNANPAGAAAGAASWRAAEEANDALVPVNSNPTGAAAGAAAWRAAEEANDALVPVSANPTGAAAGAASWRAAEEANDALVPVNANTAPARSQVDSLVNWINSRDASITVLTNHISQGGKTVAEGDIVPAVTRYAGGGMKMRGANNWPVGKAAVAQPGRWRLFGDNPTVNESYIPWKNNRWTESILERTANALGYGLTPMAEGGMVGQFAAAARFDQTKVLAALGDVIRRPPMGASQPSAGGPSNAAVVRELAKVHDLIERRGIGTNQIVVEDRSGDPVRTARETRLAMRLS